MTAILGKSEVSAWQMAEFVRKVNPKAVDIDSIAQAFIDVGERYGVRGDIAFCQSIVETHYFLFDMGTAVTPDQHNYCGMGVTSKGMRGNSFESIREGVTAQIQHLFAYASKSEIAEEIVDPRFKYVTRGIAPNWTDLNMRWAMNVNYAQHILSLYEELRKMETEHITSEDVKNLLDAKDTKIAEQAEKITALQAKINKAKEALD